MKAGGEAIQAKQVGSIQLQASSREAYNFRQVGGSLTIQASRRGAYNFRQAGGEHTTSSNREWKNTTSEKQERKQYKVTRIERSIQI